MSENGEKVCNDFVCESCDYVCSNKQNYNKHLTTAKHRIRTELEPIPENNITTKNTCVTCNSVFKCQSDLNRHLITKKHINTARIVQSGNTVIDIQSDHKHTCKCGKSYTHRSPLWYHMKRCPVNNESSEKVNRVLPVSCTTFTTEPANNDMAIMLCNFMQALSDRDDKRDEAHAAQTEAHAVAAAEQTRLLIEAISTQGPQCITNNNNNTTNNQFNLNVFLNEDCKNAFTFKEVMESIVCTVEDLDRLIVEGYAATVIRKILESMQDMAITERPIHCTDLRRNTVCVKNATGWEKGEAALKMLNNSLYFVGKKLSNVVPEWRETYPDHFRGTDSRRNQYHTLIVEVLKVDDVKLEDRNVGIICKSLVLDRKTTKASIM